MEAFVLKCLAMLCGFKQSLFQEYLFVSACSRQASPYGQFDAVGDKLGASIGQRNSDPGTVLAASRCVSKLSGASPPSDTAEAQTGSFVPRVPLVLGAWSKDSVWG